MIVRNVDWRRVAAVAFYLAAFGLLGCGWWLTVSHPHSLWGLCFAMGAFGACVASVLARRPKSYWWGNPDAF